MSTPEVLLLLEEEEEPIFFAYSTLKKLVKRSLDGHVLIMCV